MLSPSASGTTRQRTSSLPATSFHSQSVPWLTTHSKPTKTSRVDDADRQCDESEHEDGTHGRRLHRRGG